MSKAEELETLTNQLLAPLGLEAITVELIQSKQKKIRIFVDKLDLTSVKLEDCVKATKVLNETFDTLPLLTTLFKDASYELEVSSPGVDRPLKRLKDFERFKGSLVRVHTFAPLSGDELENAEYHKKNPKQKNFLGKLAKATESFIQLELEKKETVTIPLSKLSKANIEPQFDEHFSKGKNT